MKSEKKQISVFSRRLMKWQLLLILITCFAISCHTVRYFNIFKSVWPVEPSDKSKHYNHTIILLWTDYFKSTDWFDYTTVWDKCKCLVTRNRSLLHYANAVVFHWRSFTINDIPKIKHQGQVWIFYFHESPANTFNKKLFKSHSHLFDCWATYRSDSDIYLPYGYIIPKSNALNYSLSYLHSILVSKSLSVVWPVSNCQTSSKRERYVTELAQFIGVDVIGECGRKGCKQDCFPEFEKKYKFYLSFENSLCKDYFTEKIIHPLNYLIIPITMSGANLTSILPPHSFIDALQYTPRKLAQYLHFLSNSTEDYLSYFKWKPNYQIIINHNKDQFCEICSQIQTGLNCSKNRDNFNWWFGSAECKTWNRSLLRLS